MSQIITAAAINPTPPSKSQETPLLSSSPTGIESSSDDSSISEGVASDCATSEIVSALSDIDVDSAVLVGSGAGVSAGADSVGVNVLVGVEGSDVALFPGGTTAAAVPTAVASAVGV